MSERGGIDTDTVSEDEDVRSLSIGSKSRQDTNPNNKKRLSVRAPTFSGDLSKSIN